jgi:hypothetical protein
MAELYLNSTIHLHGVLLNKLNTGTTLLCFLSKYKSDVFITELTCYVTRLEWDKLKL